MNFPPNKSPIKQSNVGHQSPWRHRRLRPNNQTCGRPRSMTSAICFPFVVWICPAPWCPIAYLPALGVQRVSGYYVWILRLCHSSVCKMGTTIRYGILWHGQKYVSDEKERHPVAFVQAVPHQILTAVIANSDDYWLTLRQVRWDKYWHNMAEWTITISLRFPRW